MSFLPGTEARRRIYLMRHGHVDYLAKHVAAPGAIITRASPSIWRRPTAARRARSSSGAPK